MAGKVVLRLLHRPVSQMKEWEGQTELEKQMCGSNEMKPVHRKSQEDSGKGNEVDAEFP